MASPICPSSWNKANFGSSVCDLLKSLLLTNDRLRQFFEWMFNTHPQTGECHLSEKFGVELVQMFTPIGSTFWTPIEIPPKYLDEEVWVLCNGQELAKVGIYAKLYDIVGDRWGQAPWSPPIDDDNFKMPDLKGRFQLTAGRRQITQPPPPAEPIPEPPAYALFERGGEDDITLTPEQSGMFEHQHGIGGLRGSQTQPPHGPDSDDQFGVLIDYQDANPADEDVEITHYSIEPHKGMGLVGLTQNPHKLENYSNFDKMGVVSSKPLEQLFPEDEDDPTQSHPNMPPFLVGYTYMRANFKINGVIVDVPNAPIIMPPA